MFELYKDINGVTHEVSPDQLNLFMKENKGAKKIAKPGKTKDSSTNQSVESKNMDFGSDNGSSVLLDRLEAGDFGQEPVEKKVEKPKFDNFFTEINPTAVDNASVRVVDTSKLDIGKETIDNFISNESFEDLHKQYPGVKFNKVGLGNGTVTVKLPGQKSPRPFSVPSDDEGLGRLKFEIADYIENKKTTFVPSEENNEIDRIWEEHSKKWDAEDLMSDELQTLLGSDYVIKPSGTLGNEFTVIKDKGEGESINIMVGGADKYGNNQSSDVLKRFLTQGQNRFEDTPEYKKNKKEITTIANDAYLNNPAKLNEIFEKNNITNFSEIATPKNKEALVQHILSDQNALGGMFSTARTNFDNLTNVEIDEILTSVVDSHVGVVWDGINEKRSKKQLAEHIKEGITATGVEDIYHDRHSGSFSVLENTIKQKLIDIDRQTGAPGELDALNIELEGYIKRYKEQGGANYDVLFDMGTGKLAASVSDQKNENIINLNEQVQESMANYEGLTRDELKVEFLKTATALQEFNDESRQTKGGGTGRFGVGLEKYTPGIFGQYQRDDFDVLLQQKADLLSKMEALKRTYLLNERIETVDKSDAAGLFEQAGRAFVHSVGDDPNTAIINNGVTEAQTVAAIKDLYNDLNIPLSKAARDHSETNTFDMVAEGIGGLPVVVAEFAGAGKILNGMKYITGVSKWVQGLSKVRYQQGGKIISEANVAKQANTWAGIEGKGINLSTIGSYITTTKGKKAIEILKPTLINQAKVKAVAAVSEGIIFSAVEKDIEGLPKGIAFNLAGGLIPPAIKSKLVAFNTLYKVGASGVRMAAGNKAGEAFNALVKDATGNQEWQTFLKENYDDPDALLSSIITDIVLGGGLVGMHLNKMDFKSYENIKTSIGKFDTKRREFTNVDVEGNNVITKGKEAEFQKYNDLYQAAQKRTWEMEGLEDYSNPLLAPALAVKEAKGVEADVKKMGYNGLDVVWKTEAETGRKGGAILNKKTNRWEIELDPNNLTPGLVSHEAGHPLFFIKMMDKPTKAATIRKLLTVTKDIELREGLTLYQALEAVGVKSLDNMDLAKVQESELFSYISEAIRNGANIKGMNNGGWQKLQSWIKGESPNKSKETALRTKNDIVNWFGDYHKNIGEGGSNLAHFDKLAELVEKMTPYGKAAETTAPGEIAGKPLTSTKPIKMDLDEFNLTYGKDSGLSSRVIDGQGRAIVPVPTKEQDETFNDELQEMYSKPREPRDVIKLNKLRDFTPKRENYKTEKEFEKAKETIAEEVLTLEAGKNAYEIINSYDPTIKNNSTAGAARIYGESAKYESGLKSKGWDPIKKDVIKDFLTGKRGIRGLIAEYNKQVQAGDIDPNAFPLGKFIGGKFSVRFLESVNKFKKEVVEKSVSEETTRELVAEKDALMEALEVEDMSIGAQIKRKKLLEERGLTEETAETYVAEQSLITLSKELGIKENVVEKAQATIPELKANMSPKRVGESNKDYNKRIVSHKNSIDQYRKSIEKDIVVDFFNVSEATASKMSVVGKTGQDLKTAMAWQIKGTKNKPGDLQAVAKVVEANPATILTAISKGAQNKLDPIDFTDVAPDAIKGKSAGVPKVLLLNELLFTPTSKRQQTSAGLQPFTQSEAFIKYQKTNSAIYKADFEAKFVESLKTPQDYKAVMQEVGKNVYLQSVRSALPKESILARHLEAGKNEGLNSELFDQVIKDKPNANEGDIYKLLFSPEYNKFSAQDKIKFFDDISMKFAEGKGKSELELIEGSRDKPTVEMEAKQAKSQKEMIGNLSKDFGKKKGELYDEIIIDEGLNDWSKIAIEKTRSDIFEAGLMNRYPEGSKSIVLSNVGNGKNMNWNPATKKYELISYPKKGEKTIQNWSNHNLGGQVITFNGKKITDAEYDFFRTSKTVNTGDFKTVQAKEMIAAVNRGASTREMVEINHKLGREMVAGKNGDFNAVLKANQMKRQFLMDAIKSEIESHANNPKSGLTRQEAVQAAVRHLRRHTNITDSSIKGTATITAGSMEIGIPVGKNPFAKNFLGTMFHAEHQLQLRNFTYTFLNSLGRNWDAKSKTFNNKRYKEEMEILNELFEQSTTVKQDQLIYDSKLFGGSTTYLKDFAGKKLGEVSSILNILYQPGVAGGMVDYKSKTPKTIAESIIDNYNQKQLDILLKKSTTIGEPNALHYELSSRNKNRGVEKSNLKVARKAGIPIAKNAKPSEVLASMRIGDKAIELGRNKNKKARGMSTFDFDETAGISDNFIIATKGTKTKKIASHEWPVVGDKMVKEGWKMDFSDFNKVTNGRPGPLMQKMKNQIAKYGPENVFILTARAAESQAAIHEYLKSEGIKIPLKNITGLGNSTGEAKAMWMLQKFSEGYNDMYFVDDAIGNVKAVRDVLDQLDIKSKVQLALPTKEVLNDAINSIMESTFGIESKKKFSTAEGKVRGKDKKRRKFFMTDSASDLELLMEPMYGKGKKGVENKKWFEENFYKPWERGINDLNTARQTILNDYMGLRKQNKDIVKSLDKPVEGTNFSVDQAARVYIWNKAGFEVPGLTKTSKAKLLEHVANNPKLQAYAESVARLTKIETGLKQPKETWWAETIATEVQETGSTTGRKKYIGEWIERKNEIFTKENMAKMESELGPLWREATENMFDRMETGKTRNRDLGRIGNGVMNYLNGSVGAIMNFNTRSATLQLMSSVNFINHAENNVYAAGKAFANQPQYWKDFMTIMNSDMLKQRRDGLKINVTEAELAAAVYGPGSKAKKALSWILKQGYIPTKIADSFAISSGGATYYRNRAKMYQKQGLSLKEAEAKAFIDFQGIAEKTQQSARADLLSQQQTSFEGRLLLPFANTPMQMNRIMVKGMLDIGKGRFEGNFGENSLTSKMSQVAYYGVVQSAIFAGLQSGLFALMANSDDDEKIASTKVRAYNTMADSFLRGMGIPGVVASGVKNAGMKFYEQTQKGYGADYSEVGEALLNMSPTIGSKFSKLDAAGNSFMYNKKEILEKGFSLDNTHGIEAAATTIEAITNVPIARVLRKTENIQGALDERNENWQRGMMLLGWGGWGLGVKDHDEVEVKGPVKTYKRPTYKRRTYTR